MRFQRYKDLKTRVCGENSVPLHKHEVIKLNITLSTM